MTIDSNEHEPAGCGLFLALLLGTGLESLAIARRVVAPVHGVSRSRLYSPPVRASRPEAVSARLHPVSVSGFPCPSEPSRAQQPWPPRPPGRGQVILFRWD